MKFIRIFLLILIIIGVGLLLTQKYWVSPLVEWIITREGGKDAREGNTISDGTIEFTVPSDFGLAINNSQIPVDSYISPCRENFDYCLYYKGDEFKGTNFESAGVRINGLGERFVSGCINTPPASYPNLHPSTMEKPNYSAGIFTPIGDAAAGHFASGEIYRVWVKSNSTCYEIETRIGESQFANYPEGSITKFDESARDKVYEKFNSFLNSLTLEKLDEKITLPASED